MKISYNKWNNDCRECFPRWKIDYSRKSKLITKIRLLQWYNSKSSINFMILMLLNISTNCLFWSIMKRRDFFFPEFHIYSLYLIILILKECKQRFFHETILKFIEHFLFKIDEEDLRYKVNINDEKMMKIISIEIIAW